MSHHWCLGRSGIAGVDTNEYAWRSETSDPGAQIDLLIDRKDGIINLCEMKYTDGAFEVDKSEYGKPAKNLARKSRLAQGM